MKKISKAEQKEILGGLSIQGTSEIVNKNSVVDCECRYNNTPSVTNLNATTLCKCTCIVPKNISVMENSIDTIAQIQQTISLKVII
jgi:hypothetical protein